MFVQTELNITSSIFVCENIDNLQFLFYYDCLFYRSQFLFQSTLESMCLDNLHADPFVVVFSISTHFLFARYSGASVSRRQGTVQWLHTQLGRESQTPHHGPYGTRKHGWYSALYSSSRLY